MISAVCPGSGMGPRTQLNNFRDAGKRCWYFKTLFQSFCNFSGWLSCSRMDQFFGSGLCWPRAGGRFPVARVEGGSLSRWSAVTGVSVACRGGGVASAAPSAYGPRDPRGEEVVGAVDARRPPTAAPPSGTSLVARHGRFFFLSPQPCCPPAAAPLPGASWERAVPPGTTTSPSTCYGRCGSRRGGWAGAARPGAAPPRAAAARAERGGRRRAGRTWCGLRRVAALPSEGRRFPSSHPRAKRSWVKGALSFYASLVYFWAFLVLLWLYVFLFALPPSQSSKMGYQAWLPLPLPRQLVVFSLGDWSCYSPDTCITVDVLVAPGVRVQRLGTLGPACR